MKFLDFFAGIGGFRHGMELAGRECVGFCEYDKYAVASYVAMHLLTDTQRDFIQSIPAPPKKNGEPNFRKRQQELMKEEYRNGEWYADDIRNVDASSLPRADCWCFGFPCQDISIAGNCLGFAGKRSSLFFAVTGIIRDIPEEDKPSYLLIENVKNLLSVNRGFDFAKLLIELDEVGYDAEWDVLNSKNFGVPQNRERVFIVGHLRGRCTRKVFPVTETDGVHNTAQEDGKIHETAQCLTASGNDKWNGDYIVKCLNINDENKKERPQQDQIYDAHGVMTALNSQLGGRHNIGFPISMTRKSCKEIDIASTLTAGTPDKKRGNYSPVTGVVIPVLTPDITKKHQNGRRFKEDGNPMFTLTSRDRHGVMIGEATKKGYAIAEEGDSINLEQPNSQTRRGRIGKGVAQTLTTGCQQGVLARADGVYTNTSERFTRLPLEGLSRCLKSEKHDAGVFDGLRIRRLTPRECFRLQGWKDEYFDRAAMVNSDSQLYKQAGNGVTVNVIQAIAEQMEEVQDE